MNQGETSPKYAVRTINVSGNLSFQLPLTSPIYIYIYIEEFVEGEQKKTVDL